jgi:hypothetical protein
MRSLRMGKAAKTDAKEHPTVSPIREQQTYSVMLADDLTLVREGLAAALCQLQPNYWVIGQCSEGADAPRMIAVQRPDMAVLDLDLRISSLWKSSGA